MNFPTAQKIMWSPLLAGDGQVAPKILPARRKLKQFSQPISIAVSLLLSSCFHSPNFCFPLFHLKSLFFYSLPFFVARALSVIPPPVSVSVVLGCGRCGED